MPHLYRISLLCCALTLAATLLSLPRPPTHLTWTHHHTEYTFHPFVNLGPSLLIIRDPTDLNLPFFPRHAWDFDQASTNPQTLHQSANVLIFRNSWRATGQSNSLLTFSFIRLPLLYPFLLLLSLLYPLYRWTRSFTRLTLATHRDPERRARLRHRLSFTLALLSLLTFATLLTAGLTQSLEASTSFGSYQFSLQSRRYDFEFLVHYPAGPRIDNPTPADFAPLSAAQPHNRYALGCTLETSLTFAASFTAEHYASAHKTVQSITATPDSIRPLHAVRLEFPFYLPLPLFLLYPAWFLLITRRRRTRTLRLQNRLCPTCGYDLRASPTQCPECGAAAPQVP